MRCLTEAACGGHGLFWLTVQRVVLHQVVKTLLPQEREVAHHTASVVKSREGVLAFWSSMQEREFWSSMQELHW